MATPHNPIDRLFSGLPLHEMPTEQMFGVVILALVILSACVALHVNRDANVFFAAFAFAVLIWVVNTVRSCAGSDDCHARRQTEVSARK